MLLPFQAAESLLANIRSVNGKFLSWLLICPLQNIHFQLTEDGSWPEEAYHFVADITKGHLIYTQIADYTEEGIPLVLCYVVAGPEVSCHVCYFPIYSIIKYIKWPYVPF